MPLGPPPAPKSKRPLPGPFPGVGLFGKIFSGGAGAPPRQPPAPPPQGRGARAGQAEGDYGRPLSPAQTEAGPFPKRLRLRAGMPDYALYGAWQVVSLNAPGEWPAVKEQVLQAYYRQFGLYKLPGGGETIRWNETTWRALREELQVLFDPAFASG